jgi:hypothetical protein
MPMMPLTNPANKSMRDVSYRDSPLREMLIEILKTHEAQKRAIHAVLELIKK